MANFQLIFFLFISSSMYVTVQGLYGGTLAYLHEITYQVAILRKSIDNGEISLSCSGGIISKNLVLTVTQCFVNERRMLRNYEFSIRTDTINWRFGGIVKLIDKIYLPDVVNYFFHDIAVTSLKSDLDIENNPYLSELIIPQPNEEFYNESGRVSGYGYNYINYTVINPYFSNTIHHIRTGAGSDDFLRHANVFISTKSRCSIGYTDINMSNQFCGVMSSTDGAAWGLCDKDGGSPLVINNKVVGLGSRTHYQCNDTEYGSGYTKVSAFSTFINSIIENNPSPNTIVFNNKRYIEFEVAPAA